MSQMKVLINGCGVGGPSLAYWLAKIGAQVTVTERTADLRATGQQLDIRGQAIPLLDKMGIKEAVRSVLVKEPGMQIVNEKNKTMAFFPVSSDSKAFSSEYEIMRGDLVNILYNATKDDKNVRYEFDNSIESFTQDDIADPAGKVHVTFANGRREDFDMVVGADGVYSQTRKIMMGPKFPESLVSQKTHFAYYSIPPKPDDTRRCTFCLFPNKKCLIMRKDREEVTRALAMVHGDYPALTEAYRTGDKAALQSAWAEVLRGLGWQAERFRDALLHSREAADLYAGAVNFVKLPPGGWSQGRVTLLGDAAYASTLNGKGTTAAMAAGYVLAGEVAALLAKGEPVGRAVLEGVANYETTFRPLAEAAQDTGNADLGAPLPQSSWGVSMVQWAARAAAALRLHTFSLGFVTGDVLDKYTMPTYPALEASRGDLLRSSTR
ncbi:hypothetical protein MCOR27_007266 [Pyricularia oryzae]|uniref:FAD-binding domain-containing protein n=2 Tax=Pyricularia TaxID=48558 RepID=A0ABQ8NEX4_PYRGI|nr:hypothetical protein MCOR01_005295 [Pyricularia oryzae]KAI6295940.1 hypothetical protein MCOR33_007298 [Pyricularia grisea]KAI6257150.1 hypothetical protein MCOR19_006408 [Pyricularia oryzae]KAI6274808.1 hypothetical protein MCOR27_007266 [Pyricularia oryzae]KAI6334959.1 hypothetical protein MCOR30_003981 [Pyricularia oryzae]